MHLSDSVPPASHDARYPIGCFLPPGFLGEHGVALRQKAVQAIAVLPGQLPAALAGLDASQLDTPYRAGGWTLRQLTHHVADSHINAYTRLRLALTEEWPTIKPYTESLWAELADARTLPVETSLALLEPLHARWATLLDTLKEKDWEHRGYSHPESGRMSICTMTALYSWHGRHHTAHVLALRQREGW